MRVDDLLERPLLLQCALEVAREQCSGAIVETLERIEAGEVATVQQLEAEAGDCWEEAEMEEVRDRAETVLAPFLVEFGREVESRAEAMVVR